ncbi:MAG: hypothetical protein RR068_15230 [Hafnia sp.]
MEHFPALNADYFEKQIAERLQRHEPPRIHTQKSPSSATWPDG